MEDGVKAKKPTDFTVDCSESGPGDVQVTVVSPNGKKVPIALENNNDGTYRVGYVNINNKSKQTAESKQPFRYEPAAEPGTQTVAVKLDGKPVPQSPLRVEVEPGVDLSKVNISLIYD